MIAYGASLFVKILKYIKPPWLAISPLTLAFRLVCKFSSIEFQRFSKRDDWSDDHVANHSGSLCLFQWWYFLLQKRIPEELQGHYKFPKIVMCPRTMSQGAATIKLHG